MRLQVRARPHRQVSIPPLRRASRLALSDAPQTRAESKPEGQNIHLYVNIPG
jgi:hypothetical protein